MTRARLLLVFIAVLLWPTHAHAARGFWGWLEELSGPGPFKGGGVSLPVLCVDSKTNEVAWCGKKKLADSTDKDMADQKQDNVAGLPATVMLNLGVFNSDADRPRFSDLDAAAANNQGRVRLWSVTGLYVVRMGALDIGAGGGVWLLSGDGFDLIKKLALTPISATFSPVALKRPRSRFARLRLEFETTYIPQGFNGTDFGNSETRFNSGLELVNRIGIVVDF
jgi:hypothetical protein